MKLLLLALFLVSGCSVSKSYRTTDVTQELNQYAIQLHTISWTVERDYLEKQAFFNNFYHEGKNKNSFIIQDLAYRLAELKKKKDSILSRSKSLSSVNDKLLIELSNKNEVSRTDPAFEKIKNLSKVTRPEVNTLISDYQSYKTASTNFSKFAYFTGNLWKKSTSVK